MENPDSELATIRGNRMFALLLFANVLVVVFIHGPLERLGTFLTIALGLGFYPFLRSRGVKSTDAIAVAVLAVLLGLGAHAFIGGYRVSTRFMTSI